ncbi:peptidoglycan hydrolase RipC [Mycolicibacterium mengxianglii]|uniref:peptidoglycan hydrolase RipC n=1 Tax=Mycolicibacterium mengxianglii TaxID=2736649 RepID=UPI0018EF003F|nr:peptidoglycan hydrolase RipC [Mycolicibacterium mengxianglii]
MRFVGSQWFTRVGERPRKSVACAIAGLTVLSGVLASSVQADPAEDALAKLNALSRQAEQTTEAVHSAQLDLANKLQVQEAAEKKHADDLAAADAAKSELATFQTGVNEFAAAMYMGGRTDGMTAILTAESPQGLIDRLAVQRVIAGELSDQMANYRRVSAQAAAAEVASAQSAADAKTAAEQAAAVRAELQAKQSDLQLKIAVVKSQYDSLTEAQRVALAAPSPVPPPAGALPPPPGPEVLAAPPAPGLPAPVGIPPGDVAPPNAVVPMPGQGSPVGSTVVQAALTKVGSPYSWGGSGPGQFDCSGLVMWSFQQAGVSLPHSSQALAAGGQPVSRDQLQPGDVINFYSDASHTGIYVGDGMVVHASTYGVPVKVVPLDGAGPFYNARRY